MDNLFWLAINGKALSLSKKPFASEDEFEKKIFETKEVLEDIYLLGRQIRGGGKAGVPDMIGIDNDGNICIIEMKNVEVEQTIIPQVLSYALWAERNPDSIKSMWLESPDAPDVLTVDWADYQVRIIIIAPKISPLTVDAITKINFETDLLEVKRWVHDTDEFLLVNKMEPTKGIRPTPLRGLPVYDQEYYEKHRNKKSVGRFMEVISEIERIVHDNNWELEKKLNKNYCSFKYGFFIAFGVNWIGTKSFSVFFKLPKKIAEQTQPDNVTLHRYSDKHKDAMYLADTPEKVRQLMPLFHRTVKYITSKE